jgi:DGQHR domain-containing protein
MSIQQGLSMAAIKGEQGGREFYLCMVNNGTLNNFFTVNMDPAEDRSQRQLDPKHAMEITKYLLQNRFDYVLGALIYAVDTSCDFKESELDSSLGVLTVPLGAQMRSIDGQHRRQGLNDAITDEPTLTGDATAVLIYVEPELSKRRQMFSDLNSTPKAVSKALNVSFNARDPFAVAAQQLAEEHPLLRGRTEKEAARVKANSNMWFTLGAVHDALKRLFVGPSGRVRTPEAFSVDMIKSLGTEFFDLVLSSRPEFDEAAKQDISTNEMRSRSIMFSSTTLRVLAGSLYLRQHQDGVQNNFSKYREPLALIDMRPESWYLCGFITPGRTTPSARNQDIQEATKVMARLLDNESMDSVMNESAIRLGLAVTDLGEARRSTEGAPNAK